MTRQTVSLSGGGMKWEVEKYEYTNSYIVYTFQLFVSSTMPKMIYLIKFSQEPCEIGMVTLLNINFGIWAWESFIEFRKVTKLDIGRVETRKQMYTNCPVK